MKLHRSGQIQSTPAPGELSCIYKSLVPDAGLPPGRRTTHHPFHSGPTSQHRVGSVRVRGSAPPAAQPSDRLYLATSPQVRDRRGRRTWTSQTDAAGGSLPTLAPRCLLRPGVLGPAGGATEPQWWKWFMKTDVLGGERAGKEEAISSRRTANRLEQSLSLAQQKHRPRDRSPGQQRRHGRIQTG